MNSLVPVFVRKSAAIAAILGLAAMSAPYAAFADTVQTISVSLTTTAPTSPAHTAQNPIPVTVTFSEGAANFNAGSVTVINGSVVNVTTSSSTAVYTFGIVPATSGAVMVSIGAGSVTGTDPVHSNQASNQLQFIADPNASDAASVTPPGNTSTQAFLALSSYSGVPGVAFNALGTQFYGQEIVNIGFGNATTSTTTLADGSFSAPLTPSSSLIGATQITAIGATSGLVATSTYYVNPAPVVTTGGATSTGPNAPVITFTSGPTEGSSVGTSTVTFGFTVNDPTATVTCTFGGMFTCGSPVTLGTFADPLGDGPYAFSVTAASSTGISTSTVNFTVDTTLPVLVEVTPVATPNDGTAAQYAFTSSKAGTITLGGGCSTANTATAGTTTVTFAALASGTYNCTLTVTDAAGNVSNTLTLAPFTVNAPAPAVTSTGGGGGGGGGGYVTSGPFAIGYVNNSQTPAAPAPAPQTGGVVLGASTYNFAKPLTIGARGEDVNQLQKILIAGKFLLIDAPTAYFGNLTYAAVKAYQKAHGFEQVGNVGPLTRAALNSGK